MALFPIGVAQGYQEQCVPEKSIPFIGSYRACCNSLWIHFTKPTCQNWDWNDKIWKYLVHNVLAYNCGEKKNPFSSMYNLNSDLDLDFKLHK